MPLIGKAPFTRQSPPSGLKPDDYVFFCKTTGEVFNDYEKFFDQSILCNSVIWTCAITGKNELTFQEAVESEKKALQIVVFPSYLQRPLLYFIYLTCRRNVSDVTDDIYYFVKKRFFIGEMVEVFTTSGEKKSGVVKEILIKENPDAQLSNGILQEATISIKTDDSGQDAVLPYKYVIEETDTGSNLIVNLAYISRRKGTFTKEKCHLFIKQHCSVSSEGIWTVKNIFVNKFKLDSAKFSDFFIGPSPLFNKSPKKRHIVNQNDLNDEDDEADFEIEKGKRKTKESSKIKSDLDNEEERALLAKNREKERQQKREELKRKAEEEKEKKKEEKHKKKEEKKEHEKYLREWNRPRDDLSCEDLQDLPVSTPVTCLSVGFGDALMVLEYLNSFKDAFEIDLPNNLSIVSFCESLMECKVEGLLANLLHQLLQAIFHMETDFEEQLKICGMPLKKLQLDGYSLTEILRLHFSRGQTASGDGSDDQSQSEFSQLHPSIIQMMAKRSVFDFSPGDKLKILSALINQLLTFPTSRALIEDNYEKLKTAQRNLRIHQSAVQKRERDELQYNARKKLEERLKEQTKTSVNTTNGKSFSADLPQKEETTRKSRKKRSITELCEKDFENMPVENIDWDQLSSDEKKCIKEWSVRKERELLAEVTRLQPTSAVFPIGRDRTYRRFWVFNSVPGIFVEDDDEFVSDCKSSPLKSCAEIPGKVKGDEGFISVERQLADRGKVKWSFYWTAQHLDSLISALNPRGFREGPLRLTLVEQKQLLAEWMQKCSSNFLCSVKQQAVELHVDAQQLGSEDGSIKASASVIKQGSCTAEAGFEKALREMILDMEERIHFGSLGILKQVKNRSEWRQEVERSAVLGAFMKTEANVDSAVNIKDESSVPLLNHDVKSELEVDLIITDLAKALLQVGKMVEPKYVNPPLGEDEETKKVKQKLALDGLTVSASEDLDEQASTDDKKTELSAMDVWINSISTATSLSQLYMLMSVLEMSIAWSKSALHARCRICRRKTDGEHMLLCDGCDRGHHMYCLKPPLSVVPSGDWFCPWCRPKDFIHLPSTPRKTYKESSDSDFSENTSDEEENDNDGKDDEDEQEEDEARSVTESQDDLVMSFDAKEEDNNDKEEEEELQLEEERSKAVSNFSSARKHTRTVKVRGRVLNKKWQKQKEDEEDYEDDYECLDSSRDTPRNKRRRLNESYISAKKDKDNSFSDAAGCTSRERKKNSRIVPEADVGKRTRGRPSRLSLESAVSRNRRKVTSEYDDVDFVNMKRKKYSPIKSHFRSAENSLTVCEELVKELMKRDDAWPFLRPVTKRDAADYFDIVRHPMDFQTIQNKIYRYQYFSSLELLDDIRLVFSNCFLYNKPGTPVHNAGLVLEDYLNRRCRELNLSVQSSASAKQRKRTI